jgi:predicted DCC family thiol-disulfide oxidoreductase YuxK
VDLEVVGHVHPVGAGRNETVDSMRVRTFKYAGRLEVSVSADVPGDAPVLLFDGVCNLCAGSVQFVVERDPEGEFYFAPLQSEVAEALLAEVGYTDYDFDTVVLVEDGEYYTKSDAALRVAARLDEPWSLLRFGRVVPRVLRDWVYDRVAEYRYLLFGKKDRCMVPTPDLRERFLDSDPMTDGGRE